MGQADLEIKIFFLIFFFLKKKDKLPSVWLISCVHVSIGTAWGGAVSCNEQRWEDGSFDRGALVLHEESMEGRSLERA